MAYSTDTDLQELRPDILDFGVADWDTQRTIAEKEINRSLDIRWYRAEARSRGVDYKSVAFDPTKADSDQLKILSCYKTLALAYEFLSKEDPEGDAFERFSDRFEGKYRSELNDILSDGVEYDWDGSGTIDADEKSVPRRKRQLRRI